MNEAVKNGSGQEWSKAIPVRAVMQVMKKLSDGTYPTEATFCPCGASNDRVLVERDRYTIPHRMVLCEECCMIRANPRMTQQAYAEFYNNEYRVIYDGFPYQEMSQDHDFLFREQIGRGYQVKEFLSVLLKIEPKSVIDIGCDKGGSLMPFKEMGLPVCGVEICDNGRAYCEKNGIPTVKTIDELIEKGIKADLIIMQDIIEHLLDFSEMEKLHKILNDKGSIFIYTPGLLVTDPHQLFQNAHTYQFIGATLQWLMGKYGYEPEFLDDRVVSVWRYRGEDLSEDAEPWEWKRFIFQHLNNPEKQVMPPVRTRCKFSDQEMLANLDANLALNLPTMTTLKNNYSGDIVIVGGGPSVDDQVGKIKELVDSGHKLMVIERMYPWCYLSDLKPDFVVSLDASQGVEDGFTHVQNGVNHLVVATVNPVVFDYIPKDSIHIWSGASGLHPGAIELWKKHGYEKIPIVNTGGSVTLACMYMALVLGFRKIHLFGFDCMAQSKDKDYAKGISGESVKRSYFEVELDGNKYLTCSSFMSFAQQFFKMVALAKHMDMLEDIKVYGESLVNHMWDRDEVHA